LEPGKLRHPDDNSFVKEILRFLKGESGQELIEHAVLTGFAVLAIAIVINGMSAVNLGKCKHGAERRGGLDELTGCPEVFVAAP
jgi:Flp pilus assembly pilin Flp